MPLSVQNHAGPSRFSRLVTALLLFVRAGNDQLSAAQTSEPTLLSIHWTLHVIGSHRRCGWDPRFLPKPPWSDDCHVAASLGANLKQIGRDEADRRREVDAWMAIAVLATPSVHQPQDSRPVSAPTGPDLWRTHHWPFVFVVCQSVNTVPMTAATVSPTGRYSVWVTAAS